MGNTIIRGWGKVSGFAEYPVLDPVIHFWINFWKDMEQISNGLQASRYINSAPNTICAQQVSSSVVCTQTFTMEDRRSTTPCT